MHKAWEWDSPKKFHGKFSAWGCMISFAQMLLFGGGGARYWVAWSCHESSPSSLQVREGLGSDGSHAVLAGGDSDGWMDRWMPEPPGG